MKLRIHGDTIRVRLNRREVAQFREQGSISDSLVYGDGAGETFSYGLEKGPTGDLRAVITPRQIAIILPEPLADEWTGTDLIAISGKQVTGSSRRLTILIEKEFRRLHGRNTDPDLYPNPLESEARS